MTWDVDDRPMTLAARLYVLGMRLMRDKEAFEGEERTLEKARDRQRSGNRPPTVWTRRRCRVSSRTSHDMTVWTVGPRRAGATSRIVYLHGGGYVHPLTVDYWRLVRSLASAGSEVVVPAYPLAPEATVDDVLPLLEGLVADVATAGPTVLMGDSAGGALVLVLARRMLELPDAEVTGVVALCPWLDATLDEAGVRGLEATDPMLAESGLRAAGRWWAGERDPADPVVSPVNGSLDGLPPVDVLIGDRDILRPAVDDLAARAEHADVSLHVHEVSAMFHVWMTRLLPEATRTRRLLAEIVGARA
ncbi:hypothetical protein ASD11_09735 [Aeromicrobium sp. Root495]|nr:hypothetical protein ASD11_09735 [Aeromicrobium sp. Root495]